jgi:hypothetical protein
MTGDVNHSFHLGPDPFNQGGSLKVNVIAREILVLIKQNDATGCFH